MTPRARIALVAGALVALVVAFVVANGSGGDDQDKTATAPVATATGPAASTPAATTPAATTPATPVVDVVDAKPKGGVQNLEFAKGDTVRFTVKSDTADEIHVHGYDFHKEVAAGGQVTFSFPAKIDGRFVVELEDHGTQIAQLEVQP
jgi:hypothetical protein